MAYNRKKLLIKMIEVQNAYREHKAKGSTDKWIYLNVIDPVHHISERTFYNYLTTPARRELRELRETQTV